MANAGRIPAGEGRIRPECRVTRAGVSPMNPRVKWAELTCGHTVWRQRRPRVGAMVVCDQCSERPAAREQE